MKIKKQRLAIIPILLIITAIIFLGLSTFLSNKNTFAQTNFDQTNNVESAQIQTKNIEGENIKAYKTSLMESNPNLNYCEIENKVLKKIGYTQSEIDFLNENTKKELINSTSVKLVRSATNDGLNMVTTYRRITLNLARNNHLPVDYYLVNFIWKWERPDCIGSTDLITINLERESDLFELLYFKDSELGQYEYCNMRYRRFDYSDEGTKDSYQNAKCGEVEKLTSRKARTYAISMPCNGENQDNFHIYGECQFLLLKNGNRDSQKQLIGITYGHSKKVLEKQFFESTSSNLQFGVTLDDINLGMGFSVTNGWTYTEKQVINSYYDSIEISYAKIRIEDNGVYYIVNLVNHKPLEYTCGEISENIPLQLGKDEIYGSSALNNPFRQFRIKLDKKNNRIRISTVANNSEKLKYLRWNGNFITFNNIGASDPGITDQNSFYIDSYNYYIGENNKAIPNIYKIMKNGNYIGFNNNLIVKKSKDYRDEIGWAFYKVPAKDVKNNTNGIETFKNCNVGFIKNVGNNKVIDISGASIANGANAILHSKNNNYNQQFKFFPKYGACFELQPYHTMGYNLFVKGNSTHSGASIVMQGKEYQTRNSQEFYLIPRTIKNGKVQFKIATKISNYKNVFSYANDNLIQETSSNKSGQLWQIDLTCKDNMNLDNDSYYRLKNKYNNKCMDVSGGQAKNRKPIISYTKGNQDNQKFEFDFFASGEFVLRTKIKPSMVIDMEDWWTERSSALQAKVILYGYSDFYNKDQRFKLKRTGRNSFKILTCASGYKYAISTRKNKYNSSQLTQQRDDGSSTNEWIFEKV